MSWGRRQRSPPVVREAKHVFEGVQALGGDLGGSEVPMMAEYGTKHDRDRDHLSLMDLAQLEHLRKREVGVGRDEVEVEVHAAWIDHLGGW